jgi:hypothetical protein
MVSAESKMTTPNRLRPDGLQYVSQKRDTEVFKGVRGLGKGLLVDAGLKWATRK